MAITCPGCAAHWPNDVRFCGACGSPLGDAAENTRASRRVVTALFCDVVGSTAIGESTDPERTGALMDRYFAIAREVIEQHGGTVEKYVGDAVMAVFGWPTQFEDHALRAVRSGVEIHARLAKKAAGDRSFSVRVGLGTGEVMAKDRGVGGTFVTGDAVNGAARLEQAANPGETVIDEPTYRLVRHAVSAEPLGQLEVRGRTAFLDAYRILSVDPFAEAVPRDLASTLIGRERELALIRDTFSRVQADREPSVITIIAEPGTGKSRLVHEALVGIREAGIVIRGRCFASGGAALAPFGDALRDAAGLNPFEEGAEARSRLVGLVADAPDAALLGPRIAALAGLEVLRVPPEEAVWVARRTLEWLAREHPVVIVLDDLQWAQPSLLDLIENVLDRLTGAAVLVLAIARPEFLDSRPEWCDGRDRAQRLRLEPLPQASAATLLDRLAPALIRDPDVRTQVLDAAEGNPLFIEQFVSMLIDARPASDAPTMWTNAGTLKVPSTVGALLGARLDNLGDRQRSVMQRASIAGKRFWWGAVSHLSSEADQAHLGRSLSDLVRLDFLLADRSEFPGDEAFRFKHLLIRDAAYDAIPKAERAHLHERFAAWLVNHVGTPADHGDELIAFHLEQAIRYRVDLDVIGDDDSALRRRAASLYAPAGLAAFDRNDMAEAIRLLSRAVNLLESDDVVRIGLEFRLAKALQQHDEHERALALVDDALERAHRSGDVVLQTRGSLWRQDVLQFTGARDNEKELHAAIRLFDDAGDLEGTVLAWQHLIYLGVERLRFGQALEAAQESILLARRAGDAWLEMRSTALLASVYADGPTPIPEAIRRSGDLLDSLSGDRRLRINVLRAQALLLASAARFDEVRPLWTEAESITQELDVPWETVLTSLLGSIIAGLAGRDDEAETGLRATAELVHGVEIQAGIADFLARTLLALGRDEEALGLARQARAQVGDREGQVFTRLVEADVVARRGDRAMAENLLDEAVGLLEGSDALCIVAAALTMAGRVRIHLDDFRQAEALLQRAIGAADAKGEVVWRSRASALRATIT